MIGTATKPAIDRAIQRGEWKRVSIAEARELSKQSGTLIWWRPETHLTEDQQYALVRPELTGE